MPSENRDQTDAGPTPKQSYATGMIALPVNTLQVLSDSGEDGTERGGNSGEAETSDKGNDGGRQLDEEVLSVLADDVEEVLNGLGDVDDEVTDGRSLSDDGANGAGDGGQTEASNEGGDGGGELDEEVLGVLASDSQGSLDLRGKVLDNLATLEVLAESSNDGTDGDTNGRETKTGNEASDLGGEADEESTNVSTDNSDETVDDGAKASDESTNAGGGGDNGTEGSTEGTETKAGDEGRDLRGELNEEGSGVRAGNGQDVVELRSEVLDKVIVLDGGGAASGGRGGGGKVQDLGHITELRDNGELVKLELLGEITDLEAIEDAIKTTSGGGSGESRAGQSGDGSDERGLHCEINGYIETERSDCSLRKE